MLGGVWSGPALPPVVVCVSVFRRLCEGIIRQYGSGERDAEGLRRQLAGEEESDGCFPRRDGLGGGVPRLCIYVCMSVN